MTSDQAKSMVLVTTLVLAGGATIEYLEVTGKILGQTVAPGQTVKGAITGLSGIPKGQFSLFKRLFFIAISMIVLALFADQIPEVAGPLALLILVAFVMHDSQYLYDFYKNAGN
jgi:hypothetical protein